MNVVALVGRLTRDPDIRQSQGENPTVVARYTLAVDRRFNRNGNADQTADFISMVSFGKTAEFIEKYIHKGTKICVRGRIQTGSYTNKDGQKVYTTDVVGEDVEFAESKKASDSYDGGSSYNSAALESSGSGSVVDDGFINVPDGINEELPFA
ncbi:MAG: single-stranded DNA-binding protein [Lachnospiraceae bacterium]|nr:single-stranded DNA-binding protein [Lachnospiraceae bacterium]